jgi:hypothetical protein
MMKMKIACIYFFTVIRVNIAGKELVYDLRLTNLSIIMLLSWTLCLLLWSTSVKRNMSFFVSFFGAFGRIEIIRCGIMLMKVVKQSVTGLAGY